MPNAWQRMIRQGASDAEVAIMINAINTTTKAGRINRASVIAACAQVLAQCIGDSPPNIASEIRAGILAMIDGFAMEHTLTKEGKTGD